MEVHSRQFTEEFRLRELERGRRSLFYFGVAILGFSAPDPGTGAPQIGAVHRELAEFLEGRAPHRPWRRALVCAFRGMGKSVWTTQAYPLWRGLYIVNFSTKIIENSSDNAKRNHFLPIIDLLTNSPRADYLQWLYEHRIPPGFAGTNSEQLKLVQTDPLANPTLSYWGTESAFEGAHPDLVVLDDPEGADAEKSNSANDDAWRTYQSTIPLLKHPLRSQVLIVATPHGRNPIVWRIRDREGWMSRADNERSEFKVYWQPVLNESGESAWPERFPLEYIQALSREDIFDQQYMLRRGLSTLSLFNMTVVRGDGSQENPGSCYTVVEGRPVVIYPGFDYDPDLATTDPDYRMPKPELRVAKLAETRNYLHFDPLHRTLQTRRSSPRKQRPADAAIAAVAITDDFHALAVDTWNSNTADIDEQVARLFHLYCKWCPALVTYEGVGAQVWLVNLVRSYERQYDHWRDPRSSEYLGTPVSLPRMSAVMLEADKTNESKEWAYRENLSSWVNRARLHFSERQHVLLHQLEQVLNYNEAVDLIDCLAQGPKVWAPPIAANKISRRYAEHVELVNRKLAAGTAAVTSWMARTGYRSPWSKRR